MEYVLFPSGGGEGAWRIGFYVLQGPGLSIRRNAYPRGCKRLRSCGPAQPSVDPLDGGEGTLALASLKYTQKNIHKF